MDHGLQPKSRLAAVTLARGLICMNRTGTISKLRANGKTLKMLIFFYKSILQKIGLMLRLLVSKFLPDLSVHLKDIAEKQVPAKLKPIVVNRTLVISVISG